MLGSIRQNQWIAYSLLFVVSCVSLCLFRDTLSLHKKIIYILSVLVIVSRFGTLNLNERFIASLDFFKPFFPWLITLLVSLTIHGFSKQSLLFHAILVAELVILSLYHLYISRLNIIFALAVNSFILSVIILNSVLTNGLETFVLDVNKNLLIPELAILGAISLTHLLIYYKNLNIFQISFLLVAVLVNLIAVIFTEVRTAILVYLSIIPVLLFSSRKYVTKQAFYFVLFLILAVTISFLVTERLQQGFKDLLDYSRGQPDSSLGIRLELWKLACTAFWEHPIFGWGNNAFNAIVSSGYNFSVPTFKAEHFHNDFFGILVSWGIWGILGWISTLALLIIRFRRDCVMMTLCISSIAIGLTERFWFANHSAIYFFLVCWALLFLTSQEHKLKG